MYRIVLVLVPCVIACFLHSFPVYAVRIHRDPASFSKNDKVATEQGEHEGAASKEDDRAASKASLLKGDYLAAAEGQSEALLQQNEASAVDPCQVLTKKIVYVKSAPDREVFRQDRPQRLPRGSPFLTIGGLFWDNAYGICQVSEIINQGDAPPFAPAVKARPMTGEFAKLGKEGQLQGTASDILFEEVLRSNELRLKPLLPGSPIGTFFQTFRKIKGNGNEIEAPPRTGSVISEAWQDNEEKFFVKVKYVDDGSVAALEVGELGSIFRPGVAIKTIEFAECSTASWYMGGGQTVTVKVTYHSSLEPIQHETPIDIKLKGKIEKRQDRRIGAYYFLTLDPVGKPDWSGDAVQQGFSMESYGDSLQTFDSLRTHFDYKAAETFNAESLPSSHIPLSKAAQRRAARMRL